MSKIDYKKLTEITVKNQKELDDIPLDFKGRIYIEFGTPLDRAIVKNKYYYSVVARNNSTVEACNNSTVEACNNSTVEACNNSTVRAYNNSTVVARNNSIVEAYNNSTVVAWDNSTVVACNNSIVRAYNNSIVEAYNNSIVVAWDNSTVEACNNSIVVAYGNTQVLDRQDGGKINISGTARIVYMPKNINDFIDFYGIKHTKTKAIFYKAVRKDKNGTYRADYNKDFIYEIGKFKEEKCNYDTKEDCSYGINISHLNWALNFGRNWEDLAIIEVETKIADIVMPEDTDGKVRTSKVKVLREVPLEECGIHGKILAKRRQANG